MEKLLKTDRVLIAGGTGFIGRHLARKCLQRTQHVCCLGLQEKDLKESGIAAQTCFADMADKTAMGKALLGRKFEYVFNLGGYIDHTPYFKGGRRMIESLFIGMMNLIDCIDRSSLKGFVQVGSSDEYGGIAAPQQEFMREAPITPYSFAKTAGSQMVQMLYRTEDFQGVVLRFFLVYGPGQDQKRFLPQIINACLRNEVFKTSEGRQLRDFCFVDDIAEAIISAGVSQKAKGQVINIGSGAPVSIRDMIKKVMDLTGGGKPVWGAHPYRKGENMQLYPDISIAKNILGWTPAVSLDDGLRKTVAFYRENL